MPFVLLGPLPAGVLGDAGWVDEVELDCVLDVESPGAWPGWPCAVPVDVDVLPPGVPVDDVPAGFVVPTAGWLGLTPPTLTTVEIPPVAFGWASAGTEVVVSVVEMEEVAEL